MHIKPAKSPYYCCCICEKGLPSQNDDAVLAGNAIIINGEHSSNPSGDFFVGVADGVSNSQNGSLASRKTLELLSSSKAFSRKNLCKLTLGIHEKIAQISKKNNYPSNMQTTLCALHVEKSGRIHYINVGDSRLYRFRSNKLVQISKDQSFVEMLYDKGKISHEQKRIHSGRNLVLTAIGADDGSIEPEIGEISESFDFGDIFLLCTDGLTDYVYDVDIESILTLPLPLTQRIKQLYELALKNGSQDNISIATLAKIK
ncbi:MAG: serine/threonine-protein phosphatase [Oscillospiraceae bacterium]|nr:serine/threonine-protein phosphatase [Oscillospiraceae bacterium]